MFLLGTRREKCSLPVQFLVGAGVLGDPWLIAAPLPSPESLRLHRALLSGYLLPFSYKHACLLS